MISNLGLPYRGIGSWTYEICFFLEKNDTIDFILSPTSNPDNRYIFCEKKPWPKLSKFNRSYFLKHSVAADYIKFLLKLAQKRTPLHILVLDDQNLLEAIVNSKSQFPSGSIVTFYHHGHSLSWNPTFQEKIDQVLFLTQMGYLDTLKSSERFLPEVKIIGNGVDSKLFFPLSKTEKMSKRKLFGLDENDIVISWMANSRPVKGLHLFLKMMPQLLEINESIKILIIGNKQSVETSSRIIQTGQIDSHKVSEYLQISDFYFFTSLWKEGFGLSLVEAVKCGNFILASQNGGIPDVLSGYSRSKLIPFPNIIDAWIQAFKACLVENVLESQLLNPSFDFHDYHNMDDWEKRFKKVFE